MGQLDKPGYPLPEGELGEDEIVCQLVFLPDRPEYWQAFIGAYHYLSTWRAWERDDDKRGKDAASNWRVAFEATMECWRMACLEQLQEDVSDILETLRLNQCCNEGDLSDGLLYTDEVEDGVGDVPQNVIDAGYASGTSDWSGFDDYKCMICHVTVDQLSLRLRKLQPYVQDASVVIGGLATIAVIISALFTGGLSVLTLGLVASTGAVAFLYSVLIGSVGLGALADKVDSYHDELVCAMYDSDGSEDALEKLNARINLIFSVIEAPILTNMNLGPTVRSLYAGRYDEQDIAEKLADAGYDLLDFECVCDVEDFYELRIDGLGSFSDPNKVESELSAGCHTASLIRLYRILDDVHVAMKVDSVGVITPDTCDGEWLYVLFEHVEGGERIYESDTAPADINDVGSIHLQRTFFFTNVRVFWSLADPE